MGLFPGRSGAATVVGIDEKASKIKELRKL